MGTANILKDPWSDWIKKKKKKTVHIFKFFDFSSSFQNILKIGVQKIFIISKSLLYKKLVYDLTTLISAPYINL